MQLKHPESDREMLQEEQEALKNCEYKKPAPGQARDVPKTQQVLEKDHSPARSEER